MQEHPYFSDTIHQIGRQMGKQAILIFKDLLFHVLKDKPLNQKLVQNIIHFQKQQTSQSICSKYIQQNQKAYQCYDCKVQIGAVYCSDCFQQGNHFGHNFIINEKASGYCDCGDDENLNCKGFCTKHGNTGLVEQIKNQINQTEQSKFNFQLKCIFIFWFFLYDQINKQIKWLNLTQILKRNKIKQKLYQFSNIITKFLKDFNQNSLISNWMTFHFLTSKIEILEKYKLSFIQKVQEKEIYKIILKMTELNQQSLQMIVDLYVTICKIKEFRQKLIIAFSEEYRNQKFAKNQLTYIGVQLFGRYKLVKQAVLSKILKPVVYESTKQEGFIKFISSHYRRYRRMIVSLCNLSQDTATIYWQYHIENGCLPNLGYYQKYVSLDLDSYTKYQVQHKNIEIVSMIVQKIRKSSKYVQLLEKGIIDTFNVINQNNSKIKQKVQGQVSLNVGENISNIIFMPQHLSLSLLIFAYFDQMSSSNINEKHKIRKLVNFLEILFKKQKKQIIDSIISQICQHLAFAGLCLGHYQTAYRYQNYCNQIFKKDFAILSLLFYLLATFKKIKDQIQSIEKAEPGFKPYRNDQYLKIFDNHLQSIQKMIQKPLKSDQVSMFDRNKNLCQLSNFLNLILQATQTDTYQIFIAHFLGLTKNYSQKSNNFYYSILNLYNNVPIKEFKKTISQFKLDQTNLQKIARKKQYVNLNKGFVNIVSQKNEQVNNGQSIISDNKKLTLINISAFKSFKKLAPSINAEQIGIQLQDNNNHLLTSILSQNFLKNLIQTVRHYLQKIIQLKTQTTKKSQQLSDIGQLVVQIIKIKKAFQFQQKKEVPEQINNLLKQIQNNKQIFTLFSIPIQKVISTQINQKKKDLSNQQNDLIQQINPKNEKITKMFELKKKKLAKYRQNRFKFQQQLMSAQKQKKKNIEQKEIQIQQKCLQQQGQQSKICVVCRQAQKSNNLSLDLLMMTYLQLSDIYQHFLKGKYLNKKNYSLIFSTCGHYIHKSCYRKLIVIQQTLQCPLCGGSYNLLLPLNINHKESIYDTKLQQSLSIILDSVGSVQSQIAMLCQQIIQNCQQSEKQRFLKPSSICQQILQFIVLHTVLQLISEDKNTFSGKKDIELLNILFMIYLIDTKSKTHPIRKDYTGQATTATQIKEKADVYFAYFKQKYDIIENSSPSKGKRIRLITYHMEKFIFSHIYNCVYECQYFSNKDDDYLSTNCIQRLQRQLQKIKLIKQFNQKHQIKDKAQDSKQKNIFQSQQSQSIRLQPFEQNIQSQPIKAEINNEQKQLSCREIQLMKDHIKYYQPPEDVQELIKLRGKCDNCNTYTDEAVVCFVCQWKGCLGCTKQCPYDHIEREHMGNGIIISLNIGQVNFVYQQSYIIDDPIYKNIYNQPLKEIPKQIQSSVSYKLDEERIKQLKKIIMSHDFVNKMNRLNKNI